MQFSTYHRAFDNVNNFFLFFYSPSRPIRDVSQPVRPAFGCRPNDFLLATGQCGSNPGPATCGPSYQFVQALNQCRKIRF